jgi:hypothetical protein
VCAVTVGHDDPAQTHREIPNERSFAPIVVTVYFSPDAGWSAPSRSARRVPNAASWRLAPTPCRGRLDDVSQRTRAEQAGRFRPNRTTIRALRYTTRHGTRSPFVPNRAPSQRHRARSPSRLVFRFPAPPPRSRLKMASAATYFVVCRVCVRIPRGSDRGSDGIRS